MITGHGIAYFAGNGKPQAGMREIVLATIDDNQTIGCRAAALKDARRNVAAAGVDRWVKLEQADVLERAAPAAGGVMVMNPPYGERMGSPEALAAFYPKLGDALKRNFQGWRCYIFTADLRLPKLIRLAPSARTPLWNGALECRLYEFEIVRGRPTRVSPR